MIHIKNPSEIEIMKVGGGISREILDFGLSICTVGTTLLEIDNQISLMMREKNVLGWFQEVNNYKYNTCISVNEVWLHGMPNNYRLKEGDVVSIDLGIKYRDLNLDNCWTIVVPNLGSEVVDLRNNFGEEEKIRDFLNVGVSSLYDAISQAKIGNRVGDISYVMGNTVESAGYSVIDGYVGHGLGYSTHEDPQIFCKGTKGAGPIIKEGMVFAIEVMYAMGNPAFKVAEDGWSIVSKDGQLTGMFEHTVAITQNGPEILTK